MTSITYHLRPSSRGREYAGSLFIRVIHQRKPLNLTMPWRIFANEWDKARQKIVYSADGVDRFLYLKGIEEQMSSEQNLLASIISALECKGEFNLNEVRKIYLQRKSGVPLLQYADKIAEELLSNGQNRTARAYRTAAATLCNFVQKKGFTLLQINLTLLLNFERDLLEKGLSLNTISFYMRNLRAIYNRAVRDRLIPTPSENFFDGVFTGVQQTKKRALSKEEMCLLEKSLITTDSDSSIKRDKEPKICNPRLKSSALLFLFSFHAHGMSFVDLAFLRKTEIKKGVLSYCRRKTGQRLEMKVTKEMRDIIRYFEKSSEGSPYVFPIIRRPGNREYNQYESALSVQNRRLKEVAQQCGIPKNLSTHVARHTWATIAKRLNYSLAIISEGLGHSSEKTTAIYLASFERSVIDRMGRDIARSIREVS